MTEPMIAISFRGDDVYLKAMKALAAVKDSTVGDLVFDAIKDQYGDELKPYLDLFRAKSGRKDDHNGPLSEQVRTANPTTPDSAPVPGAKNG